MFSSTLGPLSQLSKCGPGVIQAVLLHVRSSAGDYDAPPVPASVRAMPDAPSGHKVVYVPPDGSCLFHSAASGLRALSAPAAGRNFASIVAPILRLELAVLLVQRISDPDWLKLFFETVEPFVTAGASVGGDAKDAASRRVFQHLRGGAEPLQLTAKHTECLMLEFAFALVTDLWGGEFVLHLLAEYSGAAVSVHSSGGFIAGPIRPLGGRAAVGHIHLGLDSEHYCAYVPTAACITLPPLCSYGAGAPARSAQNAWLVVGPGGRSSPPKAPPARVGAPPAPLSSPPEEVTAVGVRSAAARTDEAEAPQSGAVSPRTGPVLRDPPSGAPQRPRQPTQFRYLAGM